MQPPKGITISLHEQGSEGWHSDRNGLLTASGAGYLMMKQKNGKPYASRSNYITEKALERLTGRANEKTVTDAMRNGTDMEPVSALAYSFETGYEVEQTGFWYAEYYGASPDRLIVGQNGGVEFKNPQPGTHYQTLLSKEIPEHYYWQIIQCMLVTGADFWDYASHCSDFPENAQLYIERVERKDAQPDITMLEEELKRANAEVEQLVENIKNYKKGEA
jgi:predicted phage-related endonuclease